MFVHGRTHGRMLRDERFPTGEDRCQYRYGIEHMPTIPFNGVERSLTLTAPTIVDSRRPRKMFRFWCRQSPTRAGCIQKSRPTTSKLKWSDWSGYGRDGSRKSHGNGSWKPQRGNGFALFRRNARTSMPSRLCGSVRIARDSAVARTRGRRLPHATAPVALVGACWRPLSDKSR